MLRRQTDAGGGLTTNAVRLIRQEVVLGGQIHREDVLALCDTVLGHPVEPPPAEQNPDPDSWLLHDVTTRIRTRWDGTDDGAGLTLLAVADWLDDVRDRHRPDVQEVYLEDCPDCGQGDCDGHDRKCCWSCTGLDEYGNPLPVLYPCRVMAAAVEIARVHLAAHAFGEDHR